MNCSEIFRALVPLAEAILPHRLYAVGGSVRDALLGRAEKAPDFDVCSDLPPEKLAEMLPDGCVVLPHGGVASATVDYCGAVCEYTAFRRDRYELAGGSHAPVGFEYVASPEEDSLRRDFRCNAVYFDVLAGQTLDPLGGIRDIEEGVLRTVRDADIVMSEDPVRILRLARFAAGLGFSADAAAKAACVKYVDSIDGLSAERKRREWDGLMRGRYLRNGLDTAFETGILAKLFPALADNAGVEQPSSQHRYDALEHAFVCAEAAPDGLKTAALLHDEGKAEAMRRDGNMHFHAEYGAASAEKELTALGYPKAFVKKTVRLIALHMFDINNTAKRNTLRRFIADNADILDDLCALMVADSVATGLHTRNPRAERIAKERDIMRESGVPFSPSELKISGKELAAVGFEGKEIAEIGRELFERCLFGSIPNDGQALKAAAEKKFAKKQPQRGGKGDKK
ncbi:MAG TPA: HD domain-containing protein [Candidatus Ornithoclostridium excrementipullorum]|nr:HD domain-containing protein [Candidatus Ornithoclostridium excrementipullorum]